MSSRKLVIALFIGLAVSILWNTRVFNPIKSTIRAKRNSHNHYALTVNVVDLDNHALISDSTLQVLSHPEITVVANTEKLGSFYLSRKSGWQAQKTLNVNLVVASGGMYPKLVTTTVGLDCDEEHHEETVETITLSPRLVPDKVKYTLEDLKAKWKSEGGASLLVDALDKNAIDTGLARILSSAKKSDRIDNVLVLFIGEVDRDLAQTKHKSRFAFPVVTELFRAKTEEIKGVPAVLMSGTAEELLLLSNMPQVYFMAKID